MTIKDIYSKEWVSVKEPENKSLSSKHYFRKSNDFFEQILLAINNLSEQGTALRFIRDDDFDDSELEVLIPVIIDIAVDGNVDNLPFAKEILIKNANNNVVRKKLTSIFDSLLNSQDEYIYRRVAELLVFLNYNDLRNRLMDKCKNSENEDIVEIYTDFISQYNVF